MDRIANAAPVADDGFEPDGPGTHIRAISGLRPERPNADTVPNRNFVDAPRESGMRAKFLPPGTCVDGKYILCDVLGTGGSAVVYAAEQLGLKRVVAFKLYPVAPDMAPKLVQRFQREAELLARVHHENVVPVFDSGSMPDGSPYLVVQCLSGESLAARLAAGPLSLPEVVDLTRQALHALVALGDAGITHRDVKPDNLMLDRRLDGSTLLKLVDFGVATERQGETPFMPKELVGTPNYMAPEQVRGEEADARSDLYALGATVYELLTGRTPHTGETLHEIAAATLFNPITPIRALRADCPDGFAQIITQALAREPAQRFASARDMLYALDQWSGYVAPPSAAHALQPLQTLQAAPARAVLEDTFRIPTFQPAAKTAKKPRARRALRSFAWAMGLAALLGFGLLRPLPWQVDALEGPRQVASQWVQAGQASALTLTPRVGAVASALLVQGTGVASTLAVQLRALTRDALDAAERVLESSRALLPSPSDITRGQ